MPAVPRRSPAVHRCRSLSGVRRVLQRALVHFLVASGISWLYSLIGSFQALPYSNHDYPLGQGMEVIGVSLYIAKTKHWSTALTMHAQNFRCSHHISLDCCQLPIYHQSHSHSRSPYSPNSLSRFKFQKFRSLAPEGETHSTARPSFSETIFH